MKKKHQPCLAKIKLINKIKNLKSEIKFSKIKKVKMLRSESKVFKRSNFKSKKLDPKGETRKQKELKKN